MGPSEEMVHSQKRKLGVICFVRKKTKPGEGGGVVEGVLAKDHTFLATFPKMNTIRSIFYQKKTIHNHIESKLSSNCHHICNLFPGCR